MIQTPNHMDISNFIIPGLLIVGVAYGFFGKKPIEDEEPKDEKKSDSGQAGLIVLGVLMGGLVIAGSAGSENWAHIFGVSLMVVIPIMMFLAIGSSVGSFIKPAKDNTGKASKKKYDMAAMVCIVFAFVLFGAFPWISACIALAGIIFWVKSKKKDSVSTDVEM